LHFAFHIFDTVPSSVLQGMLSALFPSSSNIIQHLTISASCLCSYIHTVVLLGSFQDNWGSRVPECQTLLDFDAARDDGAGSCEKWNTQVCKAVAVANKQCQSSEGMSSLC